MSSKASVASSTPNCPYGLSSAPTTLFPDAPLSLSVLRAEQAMLILDDLKVGITELVEQYKESQIPLYETASAARVCFIIERILHIGLKGTNLSSLMKRANTVNELASGRKCSISD